MKARYTFKSTLSVILSIIMLIGMMPMMSVSAAQKSDYIDPADNWLETANRMNELDINATITYETQWCAACMKDVTVMAFRVPEYTKSGVSALNRGVMYSDGTTIDGEGKGNLDDGTPGKDAVFTGYHWTKCVCEACGVINGGDGRGAYSYNKNVYALNSCDNNFFLDFDNTTYTEHDEHQHTTTLKKGTYCQFCKGTYAKASDRREPHNLETVVDAQLGNNRFYLEERCEDCGYETSEYVTAKAVVASYYGKVDGDAHTVTLSVLSDDDVHTQVRYGTEANSCTLTSAPNYTQAGYYPVYYEVDYAFENESMTENGVSYVLLEEERNTNTEVNIPHVHDYRYLETVKPTCSELGYERWQCNGCGSLIKQNYQTSLGHSYKSTLIREATCTKGGIELEICSLCGDFNEHITPVTSHNYEDEIIPATCKNAGYTKHSCIDCDDSYVTDITDVINHKFKRIVHNPTCTDGGYTTYICDMCHVSFTDDYTDPLGHAWDEGHNVTVPTCEAEGVIEYICENCDEKMIKSDSATGHTPGEPATCTEPQVCTVCDAVLELPTGHSHTGEVTDATCTVMGYTTYTCHCGDSYVADYTDKAEHNYIQTVTDPTCTEHGFTTYECSDCNAEYIADYTEKLNHNYTATVIDATCTTMGYTTCVCDDCRYTYESNYTEPLGHTPSEWIVDTPATIENAGEKHIECTVCKARLQTTALPQLIARDFTDEDGNAVIGAYSIKISDEHDMPVRNAEVTIDVNDNVRINLPGGRLLSFADKTVITATVTETGELKENLAIHVIDSNSNNATGKTDEKGILEVPNDKSSTTDENGTIGNETETKNTYVVTVTDKTNTIIPNCEVYIGKSNNIVVDLPDGVKPTKENPVIVTVTDENGQALKGVTVIALGDDDFIGATRS